MKNFYIDSRIKTKDNYLDSVIENYYEVRDSMKTKEDDDKFFDAFNDIFKVLEYRDIVFPAVVTFNSSKDQYLFEKGKMDKIEDINSNARVAASWVQYREKGDKGDYEIYIIIFSNIDKISKKIEYNSLLSSTFKEVYEDHVKKNLESNPNIKGIILNPGTDDLLFPINFCEYIYSGCKKEEWEELMKPVRDALSKI